MSTFQLITSPDCGPCHIFKAQLKAYGLYDSVEQVELHSPKGMELVQALSLRTVPACLVNGTLVDQSTFVSELRAESVAS